MRRNLWAIRALSGLLIMTLLPMMVLPLIKVRASPSYKIVGYLSGWTIDYLSDDISGIQFNQLSHLIYAAVNITNSTNATIRSAWPWSYVTDSVAAGHAAGNKVLISLLSVPGDGLVDIVKDNTLRAELVTNISNLLTTYNADGIDLDLEDVTFYGALNDSLITDLYATLNPLGKLISVTGSWNQTNISLSVAGKVDLINVMTYGMVYPPATGAAPYHSLYVDSIAAMNIWVTAGFPKSKLFMGIPFYGMDNNSTSILYSEIVNAFNPTSDQNQITAANISTPRGVITIDGGVLWWNGIDLAIQKVDWIKASGFGGVMCFDVGEDKLADSRSLLTNIYDAFNPTLSSISVTPLSPAHLLVGSGQQFAATGIYSDSSNATITSSVTWVSSNTSVATISIGGLAAGVAAGNTNISANMSGIFSNNVTLTVKALSSITVTPNPPTNLAVGSNQQFVALGIYSDGSDATITSTVTWASSNTGIATIAVGGLATGIGAGSTNITAALSGITSANVTLTVLVPSAVLVSIAVTPNPPPSLLVGDTRQFVATGTYDDLSVTTITSSVTWFSSSVAMATISATGLATGVAAGGTDISASLSGITSPTVTLTVVAVSGGYYPASTTTGSIFAKQFYPLFVVMAPLLFGLKLVSTSNKPASALFLLLIIMFLIVAFLPSITESLNSL